jgi:hypothetical protein
MIDGYRRLLSLPAERQFRRGVADDDDDDDDE